MVVYPSIENGFRQILSWRIFIGRINDNDVLYKG